MSNFPTTLDDNNSLFLLANQVKSYLDGTMDTTGGNNSQASAIDLVDGTDFPSTGGYIMIGSELLSYTTKSTNKLTGVTRAYGGTTGAIHRDGSLVKMVVMAEYHNALKDAIIAIETALGTTTTRNWVKRFTDATEPTTGMLAGDIWTPSTEAAQYVYSGSKWNVIGG
jgi:hypothetical protein